MRYALSLLAVLTSLCWGQSQVDNVSDLATVKLVVTTTFGEPMGNVLVILKAIGPKAEYRQAGETISFERIPFGLYDLEIQAAGFSTRRERVGIYRSEVRLWVGLFVSPIHAGERSEIVGSITPRRQDLWVRLVPLYSSDFVEDRVKPSGEFFIGGLHPGRYVLLVFSKEDLIMTRPLDYQGGKFTLNLDVPK
jgi:hypothetical protein